MVSKTQVIHLQFYEIANYGFRLSASLSIHLKHKIAGEQLKFMPPCVSVSHRYCFTVLAPHASQAIADFADCRKGFDAREYERQKILCPARCFL